MMKPTAFGWSLFAVAFAAIAVPIVGHALALETDTLTGPEPAFLLSQAEAQWRTTKATFYGDPYDDGRKRHCADGSVYKSDGLTCATRLVPLGTVIEVKRGRVVLRLKVTDTQAKRFGHLIDVPTKTWDKFGAKRSIGMLPVQWRVIK